MRILVVDDEPAVRAALRRTLAYEGYDVVVAKDGEEALRRLAAEPVDAVVLDVRLPGIDGREVCRRLRAARDETPILMLTALDGTGDLVGGLGAGADDYLAKPFELQELLARLRALTRRRAAGPGDAQLSFADLRLDRGTREVRRGTRTIALTRTEFALLELLLSHPRQVLPRELILERVWGADISATSNALEVYVGYLRRKTEAGGERRLIQTAWGIGYVLREPS